MFKFITSKPLWVNILAAIGLVLLLIVLFFASLSWVTNFGNNEKVPAVLGQDIVAAQKLLEDKGFEVVIQDSVYIDSLAKLSVIKQSPEPDAMVKTGRTIFLTINRSIPPIIEMPNLAGFSQKSAEMYLQSIGLKLGMVSFRPDIARNTVLEQLWKDNPIRPGTKIPIGSVITLVLGSGISNGLMDVPNLIGMTYAEAKEFLATISISVGSVVGLTNISDTLSAFVVKQTPTALSDSTAGSPTKISNKIRPGQVMDIYLSNVAPPEPDTTHIQTHK